MTDSLPRWLKPCALVLAILALSLGLAAPAEAGVVARINLSSQRMDVFVDGHPRYSWPVSTGTARLSHADRHFQAAGARGVAPLHHL